MGTPDVSFLGLVVLMTFSEVIYFLDVTFPARDIVLQRYSAD